MAAATVTAMSIRSSVSYSLASHWADLEKLASFCISTTIDCKKPANKIESRSVSQRSSAALISVQPTQFWQHSSDSFSGSVRFL
jgi:hypothetical protein